MGNSQNVTIKGTKDGLLLRLDDTCSFSTLLKEIKETFTSHAHMYDAKHEVHIHVHSGNRFLTEEQIAQIQAVIDPNRNLIVDSVDSNVILKEEAERMIQENRMTLIHNVVRSGQLINISGDLLLIGDINPGGMVMASGNVFILGKLKGIAHAGCLGDTSAVICASQMTPTQLRIGDLYRRSPDRDELPTEAECAYIDEKHDLIIDKLSVLKKIRPNLNRFAEGGILHG